jgi:hypothetical protein
MKKRQLLCQKLREGPVIVLQDYQIAQELALNGSDVHQMTTQLRAGIVKKSLQ